MRRVRSTGLMLLACHKSFIVCPLKVDEHSHVGNREYVRPVSWYFIIPSDLFLFHIVLFLIQISIIVHGTTIPLHWKPLIKFRNSYYFEEKDEPAKAEKLLRPLPGSKVSFGNRRRCNAFLDILFILIQTNLVCFHFPAEFFHGNKFYIIYNFTVGI